MPVTKRIAVFALSAVLACPALLSQTFTFAPPKVLNPHANISVFNTVDLNGDGKTDLAMYLFSSTANSYYVFKGDGAGNFSHPVQLQLNDPNAGLPRWFDVNGDGKVDAVEAYDGSYPNYTGQFKVWLGDGKGGLTNTTQFFLGYGSSNLIVGDFNKDGKPDFAVVTNNTNTDGSASTLTIFKNTEAGTFSVAEQDSLGISTSPGGIVAGDFNGDGKLDLAWLDRTPAGASHNLYVVHYRYGNGNGTFGPDHTYTFDAEPLSIATAEFNHDGKADLVVSLATRTDATGAPVPGSTPRIVTLLGKSTGGFQWSSVLSLPQNPYGISLQDVNGDGIADLLFTTDGNVDIYIARGGANGKFTAPQRVPVPIGGAQVAPLVKGGLPALFSFNDAHTTTIAVRVNTSKK